MASPSLIRRVEEAFFGAWPALAHGFDDGWVLRFADGYTKRSNSVTPTYAALDGDADVEAKIDRAEAWYRARSLPPVFRSTPLADPSDLDERLAARGYTVWSPCRALYLSSLTAETLPPFPESVSLRVDTNPREGWLEASQALMPLISSHEATLGRMLDAIVPEARFGAIYEDGQPLGVAFVVVQGTLMTTFHVLTAPKARRRGLMRALLARLVDWAMDEGATAGALFVGVNNVAAGTLYEKLGYEELYRYHYRVAPEVLGGSVVC
ncbi:acyl-CoA N-acyltransferase [Lasiosphaeria ovina]|uniref:Acyl-CoA N-acyltransferase n=1 Tax=Lasiosphaeria ovina TaxID=92902 RepID=A0AAE0K410_9PEZI|nr:acyl-CoA N-acyltransferase [Lasiosphaeria ovina]